MSLLYGIKEKFVSRLLVRNSQQMTTCGHCRGNLFYVTFSLPIGCLIVSL